MTQPTRRRRRQADARSFPRAVALLERESEESLDLSVYYEFCGLTLTDPTTIFASQVRQFATALENNHQIDSLYFTEARYQGETSDIGDASNQVLGQVLGSHRSLTSICLHNGSLGRPTFMNSFVSSLLANHNNNNQNNNNNKSNQFHHHPLRYLGITGVLLPEGHCNGEGIGCIARLLRANFPLMSLELWHWRVLDGSGYNAIFEALDGNTHLRSLLLSYCMNEVVSISAVQALARSNLRELTCCREVLGFYADTGNEQRFVEGLRTNESLESLDCDEVFEEEDDDETTTVDYPKECHKASLYVDLLTTFNFTLRTLELPTSLFNNSPIQTQIDQLLEFNIGVRHAHSNLQTLSYHVNQSFIWPSTLERISTKPSLVYRFIRHGNLSAITNQLVRSSTSTGTTISNSDDALQHVLEHHQY